MNKRIKKIQNYIETSGIFNKKGLVSYSAIRLINIFFPLITYKHVLSVLGVSNFGLFASANAIIIYLALFTNYGYELTGPIEISRGSYSKDILAINKVASMILFIKSILTIVAFVALFPIAFFLHIDLQLLLISFQQIIFEALSLAFLFQGINQLKVLVNLTLISKSLTFLFCIIFIKKPDQITLYPLFIGIGNASSLLYSFYYATNRLGFCFIKFSLKELNVFFKKSTSIFYGNIFAKLYQNGPRLFFSIFLNPIYSTCYDVADKLVNIITIPISIITDSIMRNAGEGEISKTRNNKAMVTIFVISVFSVFGLFFFLDFFIQILQKEHVFYTKIILFILAISAPFAVLSNYLKIFHFINRGKDKLVSCVLLFGVIIFFLLSFLIKSLLTYSYYSGALAYLFVEVLILVLFLYYYFKDLIIKTKSV